MSDESTTRGVAPPADPVTGAEPSAVPEQSGEHRHTHVVGSVPAVAAVEPEEPDAARAAPPAEDQAPVEALDPAPPPEPDEPAESTDAAEDAEAEAEDPAPLAERDEPVEPVAVQHNEAVELTDAVEHNEAVEPADRAELTEPAEPAELTEPAEPAELAEPAEPAEPDELDEPDECVEPVEPAVQAGDVPPLLPGDPDPGTLPRPEVARRRLGQAWRPRASRAQLLAGVLCALLGFALVVQARQTQTQGLESLRQADLVRLLDNVTNAEARAEQDVRDQQAIRDRLASGTDSSAAAQEAARQRLDTLGILSGTVAASGPGIELEISDPRRQVDSSILLDTLEELRDGGAEVVQIGDVRVVAATAFTDDADGVRVDSRLLTPPYRFKVIGDPQTLSRLLQIPGGVLDVLKSKSAQGKVTQPAVVTVDALRPAAKPQYARPAQGGAS